MHDIGTSGYSCVCPVPFSGLDCTKGNNHDDSDDDNEEDNRDCDDVNGDFHVF